MDQRGQQHAQLVGPEDMATGAGCKQPDLSFLDAVLRLAALAIQIVVQRSGIALQVGDEEARGCGPARPISSRVITRRSRGQLCAA
jgi:methenyltetrahydromethanopterin cyclohydrolase